MDVSAISPVAQQQTAPTPQPDLRPTADAAALARDASPDVPLPPSLSQQAVVSAGMMRDARTEPDAVKKVEKVDRTLKPFGISMLPSDEMREAIKDATKAKADAAAAEQDARKAKDASQKAEAAQDAARAADDAAAAAEEAPKTATAVPAAAPPETGKGPTEFGSAPTEGLADESG